MHPNILRGKQQYQPNISVEEVCVLDQTFLRRTSASSSQKTGIFKQ